MKHRQYEWNVTERQQQRDCVDWLTGTDNAYAEVGDISPLFAITTSNDSNSSAYDVPATYSLAPDTDRGEYATVMKAGGEVARYV